MNSHITPLLAVLLLMLPTLAGAQTTAMGNWEFDEDRKDVYLDSVRAKQTDRSMNEIALQMGMSKFQNSKFELGADREGAFLETFDRTTNKKEVRRLKVEKEGEGLKMTDLETGEIIRVAPKDENHITVTFTGEGLQIPLRRM